MMNNLMEKEDDQGKACCASTCARVFETGQGVLENNYRCGQQPLTVAGLWKIHRNRKFVGLRNNSL